ncbi:hypothetical protein D039_5292B, partial [Vibrio parahaemolyticus EKP-028]
KPR